MPQFPTETPSSSTKSQEPKSKSKKHKLDAAKPVEEEVLSPPDSVSSKSAKRARYQSPESPTPSEIG